MKTIKHNVDDNIADPYWNFSDEDKVLRYGWSDKYRQNFITISYGKYSVLYSGDDITSPMICALADELKDYFKSDSNLYEMPEWITRRFLILNGAKVYKSKL